MPSLKDLQGIIQGQQGGAQKPAAPTTLGAQPTDLGCPLEVEVSEEFRGAVPSGWQSWSSEANLPPAERKRKLASISFYDGTPAGQNNRAPVRERKTLEGKRVDWSFGPGTTWLACRYEDSRWTLIKPLARGVRRCEATYTPEGRPTQLNCR
ncbi:STY0301 family protein [Lacibacterium aquatile]|uniref:STY0301 family protein n=1 Tax=Lacibacterium aquatile TaxID=1168082 RepID=A0ABW5DX58_9PROT